MQFIRLLKQEWMDDVIGLTPVSEMHLVFRKWPTNTDRRVGHSKVNPKAMSGAPGKSGNGNKGAFSVAIRKPIILKAVNGWCSRVIMAKKLLLR
jgi:hypothetical protein